MHIISKFSEMSEYIETVFDKVYHPALVYQIYNKFDLPELFCKSLANFLQDRTIKIKHQGCLSEPFSPSAGVPQGSVLGPLLYLMFINDAHDPSQMNDNQNLAENISNNEEGNIENNTTENQPITALNLYFADDNVILVAGHQDSSKLGANKDFRDIIQKSTKIEAANRVKVNIGKSAIMAFSNTKLKSIKLTQNSNEPDRNPNEIIKQKANHTILGITFDKKLAFDTHIKTLKGQIGSQIQSLRFCKRLSTKSKTYLFKSVLQAKLAYTYPIYSCLSTNAKIDFQRCQNKAIYNFIYSQVQYEERLNAEAAHVSLKLKSITQLCYERHKKFYAKTKDIFPNWYNIYGQWSNCREFRSKNSDSRPTPLQFAMAERPQYFYSKKYISG